jgi:hypothetical protein
MMKPRSFPKLPCTLSLLGALSPDVFLKGLPEELSGISSQEPPMTDILNIKASIPLPQQDPSLLPWILGGVALILGGSLLLWWIFRKRSRISEERNLREQALERLELLREKGDIPLRERYFELALVLRLALEGSFLPKAREKTLEELRQACGEAPEDIPLQKDLLDLLKRLGEVQFGGLSSSEEEFSRHLLLLEELTKHAFFREHPRQGGSPQERS